jgi:hypothetical protein
MANRVVGEIGNLCSCPRFIFRGRFRVRTDILGEMSDEKSMEIIKRSELQETGRPTFQLSPVPTFLAFFFCRLSYHFRR